MHKDELSHPANKTENIYLQLIMRDDTTTQLKLCVRRVACAVILSGGIFLFVANFRLVA